MKINVLKSQAFSTSHICGFSNQRVAPSVETENILIRKTKSLPGAAQVLGNAILGIV
jgi:hypothetical protein